MKAAYKKHLLIITTIVIFLLVFINFKVETNENKVKNVDINKILEKNVGINMVELDYVSEKYVIFHDYYGLFVYDLMNSKIYRTLNLDYYDMNYINGDNACEVYVDNNYVYLCNRDKTFRYDIHNNLIKKIDSSNMILNLNDDKSKKNIIEYRQYIPDYNGNEGEFSINAYCYRDKIYYLRSDTLLVKDIKLVINQFDDKKIRTKNIFKK